MDQHLAVCVCAQDDRLTELVLDEIAKGSVFGSTQDLNLTLCGSGLYGLAMELEDCAYPLLTGISTISSPAESTLTPEVILVVLPARHGESKVTTCTDQHKKVSTYNLADLAVYIKEIADSFTQATNLANTKVLVLGDDALSAASLLSHCLPGLGASQLFAVEGYKKQSWASAKRLKVPQFGMVSKFTDVISRWWTGNVNDVSSQTRLGTKFAIPSAETQGCYFSTPVEITGPQRFRLCNDRDITGGQVAQVRADTDSMVKFLKHKVDGDCRGHRTVVLPAHL